MDRITQLQDEIQQVCCYTPIAGSDDGILTSGEDVVAADHVIKRVIPHIACELLASITRSTCNEKSKPGESRCARCARKCVVAYLHYTVV
jgi:hypothetical protein